MEYLDSIINELLRTHVGGQAFFDELDERVRNDNKILHILSIRLLALLIGIVPLLLVVNLVKSFMIL